ncbi:MAG: cob(I)yrinic acid a,c-diamide adenosyltransferase [Gammaproteobacteria bacterium]|nr:cob(I)yrinic acid a,c-diamide adenosyltransferase [Gammaproteobacteria bacterium]
MGYRLSKIYTRTGDDGSTGLGDGARVSKDHARVEAYGTVDELNSAIGVVLTETLPKEVCDSLTVVQHELFDLGGELCIPGRTVINEEQITRIEQTLDGLNDSLPPLKEFVLPGGNRAAALTHLARTICRRAERRVMTLARAEAVNPLALQYLNRLSDLLFVIARYLNAAAKTPETLWRPLKKEDS